MIVVLVEGGRSFVSMYISTCLFMSLYSCNGESYGCMWVEERRGFVLICIYKVSSSSVRSSPLLECVITCTLYMAVILLLEVIWLRSL